MSSFSGLQIGLSGLVAQQLLQDTIGHNIANINTPGYSRREVMLSAVRPADPFARPPQAGLGVQIDGIRRSASVLLNRQIQGETGTLSYWQTVYKGMQEVEGVLGENGDQGLSTQLNEFWTAWRDLASDPTGRTARDGVLAAGDALATTIRGTFGQVNGFVSKLDNQLQPQVARVNTLAQQVAQLNQQISQAPAGNQANDLRDQRDQAMEELGKLVEVKSAENEDASITLAIGGHILVAGSSANALAVQAGAGGHPQLTWANDGSGASFQGGEIGANLHLRDWALNQVLPDFGRMTGQLIASVNALHSAACGLDGGTGRNFFAAGDPQFIALSEDVAGKPEAVAVAAPNSGPGDGTVGLAIAGLQQAPDATLGDSINGFYAGMIGRLGLDAQGADTMAQNQDTLVGFLQGQRDDLSAVSLDEEAVHMLGAQRAYQASARVITVMDEMLDRLINNTGLVGR